MIQLNLFTAEHIEQTFAWVSRPDLQRDFLIRGSVTRSGNQAYFASVLADPGQRVYAIVVDGRHVGNCGFKQIDGAGQGEMWIYLGEPEARGRGLGEQALRLLLAEGSGRLGLRSIVAHVARHNLRARALYQRVGFREYGEPSPEWQASGAAMARLLWSAA